MTLSTFRRCFDGTGSNDFGIIRAFTQIPILAAVDTSRQPLFSTMEKKIHFQNQRCWARSLGSCDADISGEHHVSRSILKLFPGIAVSGFHWCKDEPKPVGIDSLVANHLCKKHNSDLSSLDDEALRLFETIRNLETPGSVVRLRINLLERWFLKSAINLRLVGGPGQKWPDGTDVPDVPRPLVKTAFGRNQFSKPKGLYFHLSWKHEFDFLEDRMVFEVLLSEDDVIVGFYIDFRSIPVLLWLQEMPIGNRVLPNGLFGHSFSFRPPNLHLAGNQGQKQRIQLA